MKKYIRLAIVMILMLFVLTGCTNTEYDEGILEREYDSNLAGIESFGLLNSLKENVKKNGYNYEELTKNGAVSGCKITKEFDNIIDDFKVQESIDENHIEIKTVDGKVVTRNSNNKDKDLVYGVIEENTQNQNYEDDIAMKVEKKFFITKYSQSFIVDTHKGGDVVNTIKITYHFPLGISKSNADKGIFNLTWNIGSNQERKIEYTVYAFNWPLIVLIIIAIIVIIFIIRNLIIKRKGKNKAIRTRKPRNKKRI